MRLPGPSDLLDLPWTLADSVRSLSAALPRAETLLPLADDVLRRTRSLLDGAGPALARAAAVGPEAFEVAADVVRRVAAVATPERVASLGALVDRLDAALAPERVEAVTRAVDMLRSRADVVPRVLDAFDGLLSSGRLDRLADGLDRLLAADLLPRVDRLLDHLADERVERALDLAGDDRVVRALELVTDGRVDRTLDLLTGDRVQQALDLAADERVRTLLDLAADERVLRLLGRLDTLLAADRVPRLVDQAGALLDDERLSRVGTRLDRMLSDENLDRTEGLLGSGQPAAALGLLTRLDRELTDDAARALGTLLERLPALLSEERVAALAALTDQVPRLLGGLESGSLPRTADLGRVPTDLHAMLELIDDLHQVVSGLPGAGRARDRGDDPHPQVEDPRPPDDDAPNREAESPRTPTEGYS